MKRENREKTMTEKGERGTERIRRKGENKLRKENE